MRHALDPQRSAARRIAVAAAFIVGGCASAGSPPVRAPGPATTLAAVIDSVATTAPLAATTWGVAVQDAETGEWLARHNADSHFIPASNTKIVVTAAAMDILGPAYRWETPVFARMQPGDSVIGDIVVIGRGDPTFSARFRADDFTVTDSIAERLAAAGVRRVHGDIVVDATFFGDRPINGTWEVGDLPWAFAPPIEAFAIGEAAFGLIAEGGRDPGDPARVTTAGGPQGLQPVRSRITTDSTGARPAIDIDFMKRSDEVVVRGSVGAGATDTSRLAVTRPADYAARALEYALRTRGVRVDGTVRIVHDSAQAAALRESLYNGYTRIATIASPPLSDVVAAILRPSQNWIAEQLLKTLGAERRSTGGWSTGLDVERRWLIDVAGIDSSAFQLRDASGLSPQNLLTPASLVRLLAKADASTWGKDYRQALPEPGMKDSTLENRLLQLSGRLRAKTGSITNVNTLSGYITAADGRVLRFSIMTNGTGVSAAAVRRGMDRIVDAIAARGVER